MGMRLAQAYGMKNKIILMSLFVGSLGFVGCAKQHGAGSPAAPSKEVQILGQWRLASPGAVNAAGISAPPVLKFELNRNGLNSANYCLLDGVSGGAGYEIKGDELSVTYYSFEKDAAPGELPAVEKKFVSKISQLDSKTMVLDGQATYEKVDAPADAPLRCETPDPVSEAK